MFPLPQAKNISANVQSQDRDQADQQENEVSVVTAPDITVNPVTMVIEIIHATVAAAAVLRTSQDVRLTEVTVELILGYVELDSGSSLGLELRFECPFERDRRVSRVLESGQKAEDYQENRAEAIQAYQD